MIEHRDVQFHKIVLNNKTEVILARNMSYSFTLFFETLCVSLLEIEIVEQLLHKFFHFS